ncbi:TPA: hypothetical protein GDD11_00185 [Legionella pneumophila]|nr:hypothetical protein [Legionella pneumophila]HAT9116141.1 hypothetical protein [Legionella pneumophila subsp. pneumophila]HAT1872699.1 hypothetical protein [Legionella pneumophila]HAT2074365.1 hypothetical protein [Legionella pneumophila]HAT8324126.1 hypothetical protein [Legionella pneumophila]
MSRTGEIRKMLATQMVQARLREYYGESIPPISESNLEEVFNEARQGRSYYNPHWDKFDQKIDIEEQAAILLIQAVDSIDLQFEDEDTVHKVLGDIIDETQQYLRQKFPQGKNDLHTCLNDCKKLLKSNLPNNAMSDQFRQSFRSELNQNPAEREAMWHSKKAVKDAYEKHHTEHLNQLPLVERQAKINKIIELLDHRALHNAHNEKPKIIKDILSIVKKMNPRDTKNIHRAFEKIHGVIENWDAKEGEHEDSQSLILKNLAVFISQTAHTMHENPEQKKQRLEEAINLSSEILGKSPDETKQILRDKLQKSGFWHKLVPGDPWANCLKNCLKLTNIDPPNLRNSPGALNAVNAFRGHEPTLTDTYQKLLQVPQLKTIVQPQPANSSGAKVSTPVPPSQQTATSHSAERRTLLSDYQIDDENTLKKIGQEKPGFKPG